MTESETKAETVHGPPETVTAYRGFAVYADYDANAPDSADLIFCSTEELAKEVCEVLNEDPQRHSDISFVDGYEWSKSFGWHEVILASDRFSRTVTAALSEVGSCHEDQDLSEDVAE